MSPTVRLINPFALSNWGATELESAQTMVGDEHIADPAFSSTRSISIAAPPENVFPWLRQMGFGRAGWYSYDWVDNLGRPSARHIEPKWQQLGPGDPVPGGPVSFSATVVNPNEAFCILLDRKLVKFSLAFELAATGEGTRLVSRARARINVPFGEPAARWLLEPGDGVMVRRQLIGIKERAEALHT